jgi:hypothetical protein
MRNRQCLCGLHALHTVMNHPKTVYKWWSHGAL